MKIYRHLCPNCQRGLYRGTRVIGPGAVQCKKCGQAVNLDLTDWKYLKVQSKIWQAFREIMSPTCFGHDAGGMRFILSCFTWMGFMMIITLPYVGIASTIWGKNMGMDTPLGPVLMTILLVIGTSIYPVLLVVRLVRMILESNRYEADKKPPVW